MKDKMEKEKKIQDRKERKRKQDRKERKERKKRIKEKLKKKLKLKKEELDSKRIERIRKKLKVLKNPDGGPNPKNLKIPLTFQRKDIHPSNASLARQGNESSHQGLPENVKLKNATDVKNVQIVHHLKKLSKELVIATLKDLNSTNVDVPTSKVQRHMSTPLEIKMVGLRI